MKFKVSGDMSYDVQDSSTLILNIHALRSPAQTVLEEVLVVEPYFKVEELTPHFNENRFIRLEINTPTQLKISYKAVIDTSFKVTDHTNTQETSIMHLDASVIPFLFPSRYCQSDKLYRFAYNKFGHIENPWSKVMAVTDWIHQNVEYLSGSTNSQTSAFDTVTELAGVCRDFAHLGIALCRALSIPARYFTGYAFKLYPQDFHACFEAFIGGEWIIFDATKLVPLNGLVKIATGRDAADAAVASIFGQVYYLDLKAGCELVDENFEPFYYDASAFKGLSYL